MDKILNMTRCVQMRRRAKLRLYQKVLFFCFLSSIWFILYFSFIQNKENKNFSGGRFLKLPKQSMYFRHISNISAEQSPQSTSEVSSTVSVKTNQLLDGEKCLVNSPSCKIPWIDPFHESILDFLLPVPDIRCEDWDAEVLTYKDGNTIYVNKTALKLSGYSKTFHLCVYHPLYKKKGSSNWDPPARKKGGVFRESVTIFHERHVEVVCFNTSKEIIFWDYYAFPYIQNKVLQKRKENLQKRKKNKSGMETPNIMLIGVDSMSKQNFVRYMPHTINFLTRELGATELSGYVKVAKNTLVNFLPILTGQHQNELVGNAAQPDWSSFSYIWDNFTQEGYVTFFGEDYVEINAFDYMSPGFSKSPTDFYLRDILIAYGNSETDKRGIWHNYVCIHNKQEVAIALDIAKTFMEAAKDLPFFSFVNLNRLSHNTIHYIGLADKLMVDHLKSLRDEGQLDNTILFFFSDHGMRFGDIRQTFVGRVEDSLPAMFVRLPSWFHEKYPKSVQNLHDNKQKLTTPFDFHETLLHLLYFSGQDPPQTPKQRGYSFFSKNPSDRTCADAGILSEYCVCNVGRPKRGKKDIVERASLTLLKDINKRVQAVSSICHFFELKFVKSSQEEQVTRDTLISFHKIFEHVNYETIKSYIKVFTLVIVTTPGNSIFEGTVLSLSFKSQSWMMASQQIKRLDWYSRYTGCMHRSGQKNNKKMYEPFCYCKSLTKILHWFN